jgi:oxygen-independent coproporphyrinogen III oxidase
LSPESADLIPSPSHVYVHVPFCARRCSYCDFAIAVRREIPVAQFVNAITAEVAIRRIGPAAGLVRSLYLGGGTPSKLGVGIGQITKLISTTADVSATELGEVTVEANPEDITPSVVRAWLKAGVNRVSLGVQSFDNSVLAWMHRTHDAAQVLAAVKILGGEGMTNFSIDLIFSVPESLGRDWSRDLDLALSIEPGHLSVYGLTVEQHTPLGRWTARGLTAESPEERYEAEFLEANRRLLGAGYLHYEVSNYAKPGLEAVHNSAYWTGVPYLGLGPSAHGYDGRRRRWNVREYARWTELVTAGIDPIDGDELLGPAQVAAERVYLGLRTSAGLAVTEDEFRRAARWLDEGWAERRGNRLVLTPVGWLRLDALAVALTAS